MSFDLNFAKLESYDNYSCTTTWFDVNINSPQRRTEIKALEDMNLFKEPASAIPTLLKGIGRVQNWVHENTIDSDHVLALDASSCRIFGPSVDRNPLPPCIVSPHHAIHAHAIS